VRHVHEGGEAIVGNIGTGGGARKSKDQAHAQIADVATSRGFTGKVGKLLIIIPMRRFEEISGTVRPSEKFGSPLSHNAIAVNSSR
jgi:hypothetical protein